MDTGTLTTRTTGAPRDHDWRSVWISLALHVTVLVAIGLLWTSRTIGGGEEAPRRAGIVLTDPQRPNEFIEESDLQPVPETAGQSAADFAEVLPESDTAPVDTSSLLAESAPLDVPLPGFRSTDMAQPDQTTGLTGTAELSEEQKKMLEAERAAFLARQPKGDPTTISVFGAGNLSGRKFVFVLDRSRSMGTQGLNVLAAAADELANAVDSLEINHEFQIVAYHHQTQTITRRDLLPATEDARRLVSDFIGNLAAFGGTEHEAGLLTALSMNPDVVVLLTDGGLPELNQAQLRRIRQAAGKTQIHCVQFGDGPRQTLETFMRQLASDNDGTYRYVDVSSWRKKP